jgi:serine/tyrosine/threonine adenylyltransferase
MKFHYKYKTLPHQLYHPSTAEAFSNPKLIKFNYELSKKLGLNIENYSPEELGYIFSGQKLIEGCAPYSLAYAGHQFGHFVPLLGDGRAMVLGEVLDPIGQRYDIQLKGTGRTIYSRNGDGKSALGPVLREYIVSEAMYHLGIPTTRSLAAVTTGDMVYRENSLPGAILTRVASSHIRIGTFQYMASRGDIAALMALLDYSVSRHFPELKDHENLAFKFLQQVIRVQAKLVAHWMSIGFIHGVMNTDNMSISGETIDYGPCAFMDYFDFNQVYSFIDKNGRYSYGNQPKILNWNLARLAECFIPIIKTDETQAIELLNHELRFIPKIFKDEFNLRMKEKFGLRDELEVEEIVKTWFDYLQKEKLDFTQSFRNLSDFALSGKSDLFPRTELLKKFESLWRPRIQESKDLKPRMDAVNPYFIPRNHQIEKVINSALSGDYSLFNQLNDVLSKPFTEQPEFSYLSRPPRQEEKIKNTFCGT